MFRMRCCYGNDGHLKIDAVVAVSESDKFFVQRDRPFLSYESKVVNNQLVGFQKSLEVDGSNEREMSEIFS